MKANDIRKLYGLNLCNEIILPTNPKPMPKDSFKFSRKWHQAHFNPEDYYAVRAWCSQQFGPHPANPDAWSRWWHKFEDSILFRDEKDYVLFMLRWSV